jgi:hypothetical protein
MNGVSVRWDHDSLTAAIAPVDEAFRAAEKKYGVDRLPRLCSEATILSFRKGWAAWSKAIIDGDVDAVRRIAPRMLQAIAYMDAEATAAGATPLDVATWEVPLSDGSVLVIVRTQPEAHAVATAHKLAGEDVLPPDLARAVRHQQEGRRLVVYSLQEVARVIEAAELVNVIKREWPGATVVGGPVTSEGAVADWAKGDPLAEILSEKAA